MESTIGVNEVKRALGYRSERSVYRLIHEHGLPAYRVRGQYRFRPSEVDAWLDARRADSLPTSTK